MPFVEKRRLEPGLASGQRSSTHVPLQPKSTTNQNQPKSSGLPDLPPVKPSKLLSNLANIHANSKAVEEPVERTTSFSEAPITENRTRLPRQERDNRLALVETLTPGPQDHVPPVDDPHFSRLEPNSGIHLSCVLVVWLILPH
jgi:minichromosome maintenance protein 10